MNIRELDENEIIILMDKEYIPAVFSKELTEIEVYGGFSEEGKLLCMAAFSDRGAAEGSFYLIGTYKSEAVTDKEYAEDFFAPLCDELYINGITDIYYESFVENKEDASLSGLHLAIGFDTDYPVYSADSFANGHFIGKNTDIFLKNLEKAGYAFEEIDNFRDSRLETFLNKTCQGSVSLDERQFEPQLCSFALEDDKIVAALCLKKLPGDRITIAGIYVDSKLPEKEKIVPFLLSLLVKKRENSFYNFDRILISYKKAWMQKAIETVFGKAQKQGYYLISRRNYYDFYQN